MGTEPSRDGHPLAPLDAPLTGAELAEATEYEPGWCDSRDHPAYGAAFICNAFATRPADDVAEAEPPKDRR